MAGQQTDQNDDAVDAPATVSYGVPENWRPYERDGQVVTLTGDQVFAVQRAFFAWSQVVDREQADRDPKDRQNNMANPANWQKSCLLGRMLMDGKPPLPVPPPRAYSAPWYSLIENGWADLTSSDVSGPYEDEDGRHLLVCQCRWRIEKLADDGVGWVVSYPRNGEWLLRPHLAREPVRSANVNPMYVHWVLERLPHNGRQLPPRQLRGRSVTSHQPDQNDDTRATGRMAVSVGSKAEGYPCPKDGAVLALIETTAGGRGAWCPTCHTVWVEIGEADV